MDAVFYQFFRNAVHNEFSFPAAAAAAFPLPPPPPPPPPPTISPSLDCI